MAAHTVTLAKGTNVSTVVLGSSGTTNSYNEGDTVNISATCASGKSFAGWNKSSDFGTIANSTVASTTYTVGGGDVTLTAYCTN